MASVLCHKGVIAIDCSFKAWEGTTDLDLVCAKLLDNANMDVNFTDYPFAIALVFYVIGSDIKVRFICSEIEGLSLEKDWNDGPLYVALEANVKSSKLTRDPEQPDHEFSCSDHSEYLWEISVLPEANLNIKCLSFDWSLEKITDEELSWLNAS